MSVAAPVIDPNLDPRVTFEQVIHCPCGGAVSDGPIWGWGTCGACGTWVNTRRPTEASLGVVYGEAYWTITQALAGCPTLEQRFESDLHDRVGVYLQALLPHLKPGGRIAEIGCGNARLLHELAERGFAAEGAELLESVISRVRRLTRVSIRRGGAELFEPASLDGLISIDVLEHVHQPLEFLQSHAKLLRPGGVMLVHTPVHSEPHQPYGYSVGMLWKLYHLYLFSRRLIDQLFKHAGLDVVSAEMSVFGWPVFILKKS